VDGSLATGSQWQSTAAPVKRTGAPAPAPTARPPADSTIRAAGDVRTYVQSVDTNNARRARAAAATAAGGAVEPSPCRWMLLGRRSEPNAARGWEDTMRYCDAPMPRCAAVVSSRHGTAPRGQTGERPPPVHPCAAAAPPCEQAWPQAAAILISGRAAPGQDTGKSAPDRSRPAGRFAVAACAFTARPAHPTYVAVHRVAPVRRLFHVRGCGAVAHGVGGRAVAYWLACNSVRAPAAGGPAYVHISVLVPRWRVAVAVRLPVQSHVCLSIRRCWRVHCMRTVAVPS
jgi:hypothetical protein